MTISLLGVYFDKETGTIYLRARYYDPATSRMLTEDSYWGDIRDTLSLNLYTYCQNNPVNFRDPSGHIMESDYTEFKGRPDVIIAIEYLTDKWNAAKTQEAKNAIHQEAENIRNAARNGQAYNDRTSDVNTLLGDNVSALANTGSSFNLPLKVYMWYDLVRPGGSWDYKVTYSKKLSWMPEYGVCMYDGKFITAEELGNINYGYTGTALGFGSKTLFTGGGWAAQREKTADTSLGAPYYGDSVHDHNTIQWGIDIYYQQNPSAKYFKWSLINIDVRPILNTLFGKN